jgi:hypothetical protein
MKLPGNLKPNHATQVSNIVVQRFAELAGKKSTQTLACGLKNSRDNREVLSRTYFSQFRIDTPLNCVKMTKCCIPVFSPLTTIPDINNGKNYVQNQTKHCVVRRSRFFSKAQ